MIDRRVRAVDQATSPRSAAAFHDQDVALWHAPFGIRLRPKLPASAEGDQPSRIFRRYSVSVPDFRDPEYAAALDKATREAPSGAWVRR